MLGTKHSEKTKKKMSEKRTGMVIKKKTDVLDEDIVRKIKELLISGKSASQVAKELSVNYKNINKDIKCESLVERQNGLYRLFFNK